MATLYLIEQNTILRMSGERILFCKRPPAHRTASGLRQMDVLMEWPCADIEQVMLFGNIQITTQAMHQLLLHGIETALFSLNGALYGQLTPPGPKNIIIRQHQSQKFQDQQFVLEFSKTVVRKKIQSMLKLLKEQEYNHPGTITSDKMKGIEQLSNQIQSVVSLESLLGFEGAASAHYFKILGRLLPAEFQFALRTRRPPKDPANAVLSFGYTVVGSELQSLVDGIGFDPYLGFYHQIQYGRAGLSLDLLELYRHVFIDRLMLNLFNLKILNRDDFMNVAKGGIYLSISGKQKFFGQYEKMVGQYQGEIPVSDQKTGFRKMFQDQVRRLMLIIQDKLPLASL